MNTNDQNILQHLPQTPPPDSVWDHIEEALNKEEKRRIVPLWRRYTTAAAVCLFLCGIGYLWYVPAPKQPQSMGLQTYKHTDDMPVDTLPRTDAVLTQDSAEGDIAAVSGLADSVSTVVLYDKMTVTGNGAVSNAYYLNTATATSSGTTYHWDFGYGFAGSANPSYGYTTNGTYDVTLQQSNWSNGVPGGKFSIANGADGNQSVMRLWEFSDSYGCDSLKSGGVDSDGDGVSDYFDPDMVSDNESYAPLIENEYQSPYKEPLSTFSIDVDNASYTNSRRMIEGGELPPKDAVRIEEFVNYFDYHYPQPKDDVPFSINLETASCPWNTDTRLVHIGLQGKDVDRKNLPASNLVFLIDVSGSMEDENKLPLVKQSLKLLVDQMQAQDRIAVVTYAGAAGLALKSTACSEKEIIKKALSNLEAGGSTAGGEGLELAYKIAKANLKPDGNNRIILVTDGDFNVGLQTDDQMKTLIEDKRKEGIYLTVCGFGMGNYKDSKMETLADYGNGNYYYIDTYKESNKVFVKGLTGMLFTIAKDVKIQVEFNPKFVKAYRLIGYENRMMPPQDFADDTKDAGELGAGHTVTALYEIIPAGSQAEVPGFTELKYQQTDPILKDFGNEMLTVKLRYKRPKEDTSNLLEQTLATNNTSYGQASDNLRFASGVIMYGMLLRDSKFKGQATYDLAKTLLQSSNLNVENGYKEELLQLIDKAKMMSKPQ